MNFTKRMKNKWLTALKSGEFTQARGALRVNHEDGTKGYCCIGVLCEILPDFTISEDGGEMFSKKSLPNRVNYQIMDDLLGEDNKDNLILTNDDSSNFDRVIPIIEKLPTHY